ncbi:MAG: hypothetical protein QM784_25055 [Polyangiaceae bacterium]
MNPDPNCELCRTPGGIELDSDDTLRIVRVPDPSFPAFLRVILQAHEREMTDLPESVALQVFRAVLACERVLRRSTSAFRDQSGQPWKHDPTRPLARDRAVRRGQSLSGRDFGLHRDARRKRASSYRPMTSYAQRCAPNSRHLAGRDRARHLTDSRDISLTRATSH